MFLNFILFPYLCQSLVAKFGARDTEKKPEHPVVIRHHDERALRLRDTAVSLFFSPSYIKSTFYSAHMKFLHDTKKINVSFSATLAVFVYVPVTLLGGSGFGCDGGGVVRDEAVSGVGAD